MPACFVAGGQEPPPTPAPRQATLTLTDIDAGALARVLALSDPRSAAAATATCRLLASVGGAGGGAWRALAVDARSVPDARALPRRWGQASLRPRAAADVGVWLTGGRGAAAQALDVAWRPDRAASAAAAAAALAGAPGAADVRLVAEGALEALPRGLLEPGGRRRRLARLALRARAVHCGLPPAALAGLEVLEPLLPPPGKAPSLAALRSVTLIGTGVREIPPALAAAPLTSLCMDGAALGRERYSAAATGAWSPTAALAGPALAAGLTHLALTGCGLASAPPELAACGRLQALDLGRNALRSFSLAPVRGLTALTSLCVAGNALGAPLPPALLAGLPALVTVDDSNNPYQRKAAAEAAAGRGRRRGVGGVRGGVGQVAAASG